MKFKNIFIILPLIIVAFFGYKYFTSVQPNITSWKGISKDDSSFTVIREGLGQGTATLAEKTLVQELLEKNDIPFREYIVVDRMIISSDTMAAPNIIVHVGYRINGITTNGSQVVYRFTKSDGELTTLGSIRYVGRELTIADIAAANQTPKISTAQAKAEFRSVFPSQSIQSAELVLRHDRTKENPLKLAYKVVGGTGNYEVHVDAIDGKVLYKDDGIRY